MAPASSSGGELVPKDPTGSLTLSKNHEPFTFDYSTSQPQDTNWIGLYHASGGGPVNESYIAPPIVWKYAPDAKGSVHLPVDYLEPGEYEAYFLAHGGYKWLAPPITVTLEAPPARLYFPVQQVTLHNARKSERYVAHIGGLLLGRSDAKVVFEKTGGDRWIRVDSDGTISGTPSHNAPQRSHVDIRATADNGASALLKAIIPVRPPGQALVEDLRVMTFNMWHGGTQVNNYHEKQLRFVLESGADIIGLQEATSDHAIRLGEALGWHHWQSSQSVGIISRYPIVEEYGEINRAGGVRISLNGNSRRKSEINFWSTHLGYNPYGPYDFCYDHMSFEQVLEREAQSGRTPQITELLGGIQSQLNNSKNVPVILVGDFNAPSHLDWTEALREKNCGIADFPWPTSVLPTKSGFIDSFRVAHPDPAAEAGVTWSPLFPFHNGDSGNPEPQDRIDFIYHTKEKLSVMDSQRLVVGNPKPSPHHKHNKWTSDHAAVLTHYHLK
ncbi:hypothetical protein VTO42DRAFT_8323 [Malbranchea cinnamomea]